MPVRYFSPDLDVCLGDHIETRFWYLFKTRGRIVYVPGVSPLNREFEHHGLRWVGVYADDGALFGELVDPKTERLLKRVKFVRRDAADLEQLLKILQKVPVDPREED